MGDVYEGVELMSPVAGLEVGAHAVVVDLYEDEGVAEVELMDAQADTVAVEPVDASNLRVVADAQGRPPLAATTGTKS
jgi:hypothetical protein